jgi:NAD(P)H-hydrate epimerase
MTVITGVSDKRDRVPVVTASQMREVDRLMVDEAGITLTQMMENAGRAVARVAVQEAGGSARRLRVVVLAGSGGNGGGGLVAARRLACWGARVVAVLSRDELHGVPAQQREAAEASGVHVLAGPPGPADLDGTDVVIDAILGYSLAGAPSGPVLDLVEATRGAGHRGIPVVSLDLPSGLDPDTGVPPGAVVTATHTVTLALPKPGLLTEEGRRHVGALSLADISVPEWVYQRVGVDPGDLFSSRDIVRLI